MIQVEWVILVPDFSGIKAFGHLGIYVDIDSMMIVDTSLPAATILI